jgi:exo-beta-1,3-glucanase (GH17 family)
MFTTKMGICYSGYRNGQSPRDTIFPNDEHVLDDLKIIISLGYEYIRMYDVSHHPKQVLNLIHTHQLPLKVMLGVEPKGELDNPHCAWGGRYSLEEIQANQQFNMTQLDDMLTLLKQYEPYVLALSVANENTSDWHPNLMPEASLVKHVKYLKKHTTLPITFCEGAYFWLRLDQLAHEVDFISIHSYPQWHKQPVKDAFEMTVNDYEQVKQKYPQKPIIFTEYGWTTTSTDIMNRDEANEDAQTVYLNQMDEWLKENHIQAFVFEAFDEFWKGSLNPLEPEKHWGIMTEHRQPKKYLQKKAR